MIRVAVCTGLRRGELLRLRWRDVDLDGERLRVASREGEETKSGHERQLPLRGDALDVLHRMNEERPAGGLDQRVFTDDKGKRLYKRRPTQRFKFFVRKAKLPQRERLRFHSLRHTCASWLVMRSVPSRVVQAILGHSSVNVTERYSHLQPEVMEKAMEETFG
jgi:integrase